MCFIFMLEWRQPMKITVNNQFFDYLFSSQSLIIAWMWNPPQEFNFMSFFHPSNSNFYQSHRQIKPMLARKKNTKNRPDSFLFWWLRKIVYKHWKSTRLIDQLISSWHLWNTGVIRYVCLSDCLEFWASRLEFGLKSWKLSQQAEICANRLRFGP